MQCKYNIAWVGQCSNEVTEGEYCHEHKDIKCCSCGEKATRQCPETGQLVCGAPLCDNCEHTTAKDGTNGGIGFFRLSPLPEGYKEHCRKDAQVYKPWWEQEEKRT